MTRDEAVTRIKRGLDFRTGTTRDADIASQLQESQRLLEKGKYLPRFLIQEAQSLAVTSGSGAISLPTGFLREVENEGLQYTDSETDELVSLEKLSYNEAQSRFAEADAGRPIAYVLRNSTILIYPERDTSYTLTWSYYKKATELSTGSTENEWLTEDTGCPEALIGHAGMVIAKDLNNPNAVQRFTDLFNEAWTGQLAEDIEREWDNDPVYMGGRL